MKRDPAKSDPAKCDPIGMWNPRIRIVDRSTGKLDIAVNAGDRRCREPVGVVLPAARVNALERVVGLVPNDAVTPFGSRLAESVMLPLIDLRDSPCSRSWAMRHAPSADCRASNNVNDD